MSNLEALRHSAAHVLAMAVKKHNPKAKLAIGPATEEGFYYDFDNLRISEGSLKTLTASMKKIIKQKLPFKKEVISKEKVKRLFKGNPYKLELIKELKGKVSIYKTGDFVDLCKGPHVKNTGEIKAVKLLNIAGAYWKGDEKNPMLTRIYGTAFASKKELKNYLDKLEQAQSRDHIKLGKQLDLFSLSSEVGAGLALWHPKGAVVREVIEDFWKKEHVKRDYQYVYTPHIGKATLWKKSGHLEFFKDSMYGPIKVEDKEYRIKPMNCPFHIEIYNSHKRSYKELPLRYCELGTVYRFERSGTLHGLTRVRGFTQDDAHIFCTFDQLQEEVEKVLELSIFMMKTFGFKDIAIYLSTRDSEHKFLGTDKMWNTAEGILKKALKGYEYKIDEGGAIFYGPKIDIKIYDSLGREWQGPTIQVDFNFPEKFNLTYIGEDNKEHRIVMIHRTVIGSMERFMGNLIEHYAGAFPTWLAPVQIKLLTFTSRNKKHAKKIEKELADFRVETDYSSSTVQAKVRDASLEKIPWVITVGDKEQKNRTLAVRSRDGKVKYGVKIDTFVKELRKLIEKRM